MCQAPSQPTAAARSTSGWRQRCASSSARRTGRLAANTVAIGDTLVMSACSARLRAQLRERGYRVATTSLAAFHRSGGSAFCLTLRLDRRSARGEMRQTQAA